MCVGQRLRHFPKLTGVRNYHHLDLRQNKISYVPLLTGLPFKTVDLRDNPLNCSTIWNLGSKIRILQNSCMGNRFNKSTPASDNRRILKDSFPTSPQKADSLHSPTVTIALSTSGAIGLCVFLSLVTGLCVKMQRQSRNNQSKCHMKDVSIPMESKKRAISSIETLSITSSETSEIGRNDIINVEVHDIEMQDEHSGLTFGICTKPQVPPPPHAVVTVSPQPALPPELAVRTVTVEPESHSLPMDAVDTAPTEDCKTSKCQVHSPAHVVVPSRMGKRKLQRPTPYNKKMRPTELPTPLP